MNGDRRQLQQQMQEQMLAISRFYQAQLDELRALQRAELRRMRAAGLEQLDQLQRQHQEQMRRLKDAQVDEVRRVRRAYDEQIRQLQEVAQRQRQQVAMVQNVVGRTVQTGQSVFSRGYAGTVIEAQMSYELKMLGRELVNVFSPVIRITKEVVSSLRRWLQSLDETGQNLLMFGGLALMAVKTFGGVGSLLGGVGRLAGGGLAAAGAAAGLAGLAGGGMGAAELALAAAGTYGAMRMMRGAGAAATAARTAGAVETAAAATRAAGAAATAARTAGAVETAAAATRAAGAATTGAGAGGLLRGAAGKVLTVLRAAGPVGAILTAGTVGYEAATGGYYTELRARGNNKFVAGVGAVGGAVMDTISQPLKFLGLIDKTYGEAFRERMGTGGTFSTREQLEAFQSQVEQATQATQEPRRRTEAISGGGFESLGSAYEAVGAAISRVQTPSEKYLAEIRDILKQTAESANRPKVELSAPMRKQ